MKTRTAFLPILIAMFLIGSCSRPRRVHDTHFDNLQPGRLYVILGSDAGSMLGETDVKLIIDEGDPVRVDPGKRRPLPTRPDCFYAQDVSQYIVSPYQRNGFEFDLEPGTHSLMIETSYCPIIGSYANKKVREASTYVFPSDPLEFEISADKVTILRLIGAYGSVGYTHGLGSGHQLSSDRDPQWHPLVINPAGETFSPPGRVTLAEAGERAAMFTVEMTILTASSVLLGNSIYTGHNPDYHRHTLQYRYYIIDGSPLMIDPADIIFPDQVDNLRAPVSLWCSIRTLAEE